MAKRALIFYAVSVLIFSGCATTTMIPISPNERIMVYGDFMSKTYQQKGETIPFGNLQENLVSMEKTSSAAKKSKVWAHLIWPSAIAGVGAGMSALTDNSLSTSGRDTRLGIGLGLIGVSLLSAYFTQNNLDDAVDQFNQKFPALPQPEPTAEPEDEEESSQYFHFDLLPSDHDVALNLVGGWHF